MEQVRAFIAVELPEELRAALGTLQDRLKLGNRPWVKSVDPYSVHLTLKFLGNISVARIDGIVGAMREAAGEIPVFRLEVRDLGVFPNLRRVQVVWVGLNGEVDLLNHLQRRIETNLVPLGFARELREFQPHLTLARVRDRASIEERQSLGNIIASTSLEIDYAFDVKAISLMKSQLTREGAVYSRIESIDLK